MSDSKPGIEYFDENNKCIYHCESEILKIIKRLLQILEKILLLQCLDQLHLKLMQLTILRRQKSEKIDDKCAKKKYDSYSKYTRGVGRWKN